MKIAKKLAVGLAAVMVAGSMTACASITNNGADSDRSATMEAGNKLAANQPTPTDIDYSLERYNLIRRAYWVNGQREKANALPCQVQKPLGYIVLITESGTVVGRFVVDGKVSSLNSYLTPDSEVYENCGDYADSVVIRNGTQENDWLADVDGSYGENDNGIFFFTPDGKYLEWTGTYLYSDIPFELNVEPIVAGGEMG